jgi:diguanylate cyclase (GGDEF)-like protein
MNRNEPPSQNLRKAETMRTGSMPSAQTDDELHRVRRALNTLRATNRALLRAADEASLLSEICRVVVEDSGYRFAWVGYAEQDEPKTVRPMAHAGFEDGYLATANITWADTERGRGPTGTAIRTGKPSVVRNMLTDPNVAPWREDALKRGYASAASLPLRVDQETIGVLNIRAAEPDAFDEEELNLLSDTADDLAYGIQTLRMKSKREQAEQTIQRMAFYDALTGLPNRVRLRELLEKAIVAAKQQRRPLSLLLVGTGRFSEINEALGYREGDKLLQEIALRLQRATSEAECVARMGEDQFAVLMPNSDAEQATRFAAKILLALYEPVELSGLMLDPRASIGISLFPGHGTDPDALIRRAHVGLHQAKRTGSGYAVYTGGLDKDSTPRLALMGDLRSAIDNNELLLYCQPKVEIGSGRICGAEALVRWRHPEKGMINPGEFIALAESTGLITPLTFWMLGAAVSQSYAWREEGLDAPLAVNLSAYDLRDPKLLDRIKGSFATWGAQPDWIQFELTESALMQDPAGSLATLGRLKDLGVELFIDDFGTGYSSLAYLQKLPVDAIKVDQSFVGDMIQNNDSAVIVRSTIDLAHSLELKVVGEGVENRELWERLVSLRCDVAQGYYVSPPIPADELGKWAEQSPWRAKRIP